MFYRWVFPNAQEQGQWRLDRSSLQDWTVSAERFQGNSVRSTYTDKHKFSIKHTYIYTYSTSLHVFANHRYSLSIHTTRFPHIILITMDHYTGFEAPIRHFNCIPDLWHFVYAFWGMQNILEALIKLHTWCSFSHRGAETEQWWWNLKGDFSSLDIFKGNIQICL